MLLQKLRDKLTECRKSVKRTEMSVLQVVIGEVSEQEGRGKGSKLTDEAIEGIIRKVIESNNESLSIIKETTAREKLEVENKFLDCFLPSVLDVSSIKLTLASIMEQIKTAKSDGQATGIAMKFLKSTGTKVLGEDVSVAVKEMRAV